MKTVFLIAYVLFTKIGYTQSQKDRINVYISNLTNSSVFVNEGKETRFRFDPFSEELLHLKDSTINRKLFAQINDKNKTLAIHAVLTQRLGNKSAKFCQSYSYKDKKVVRVNNSYNNLNWYQVGQLKEYKIDDSELAKIKAYWLTKIK